MNHALTKGIYYLTIKLVKKHNIRVGCLGNFGFPRGFYVYVGSAQNNLEGRIKRHLRRDKKMRWHIDYLLHYGQVICVHTYAAEKNAECILSQKIGNMKTVLIPASGFGSSDCLCASHLYFFQDNPDFRISRLKLGLRRLKTCRGRSRLLTATGTTTLSKSHGRQQELAPTKNFEIPIR